MKKMKVLFLSLLLTSTLSARYENDKETLGNISITLGIFNANTNGMITNEQPNGATNYENDLGFKDKKNINTFALDLKNDVSWLPNVNINYFKLNNSATNTLTSSHNIAGVNLNGSVSSDISYQEINTIMYGYLYQGPFEFNFGLNLKKIDYTHTIHENNGLVRSITIEGPTSILVLPYMALKFNLDFIDTVVMAKTSILSFGDNEAKDYDYSLNYRVMRNIFVSYGYRYNSFKTTNSSNSNEIYDINIKGSYISFKILF
jgi:hypothetical protein